VRVRRERVGRHRGKGFHHGSEVLPVGGMAQPHGALRGGASRKPQEVIMTRNLVLATAALAVVGCLVATSPTEARYVLSGLKEYANAPVKALTPKDCRAVYNGHVRLVSAEAFSKYLARHRGEVIPLARDSRIITTSWVEPRRRMLHWPGGCGN
jgi:hypothetical protein